MVNKINNNNNALINTSEKRVAILIDGDNAQSTLIEEILVEAGKYGNSTIRRVYGDWTTSNMKSWKEILNSFAFQPIQQFRYTIGKNATDSAMIIDAMDILHMEQVDGFCLVSSDSDYTRLATRIRESGKLVIGIGRKLTPRAFVSACNVFIYTENLAKPSVKKSTKSKVTKPADEPNDQEMELIDHINQAIDMTSPDDDGWTNLSEVGTALRRIDPSFDPRTYGVKQLSQLIRSKKNYFNSKKMAGKSLIQIRSKDED